MDGEIYLSTGPVVTAASVVSFFEKGGLFDPPSSKGCYFTWPKPVLVALSWILDYQIGAVRPGVDLRAVVGRVHDDGVIGDTQLVEFVEHLADLFVVGDHPIAVVVLPALSTVLVRKVSSKCIAVELYQRHTLLQL